MKHYSNMLEYQMRLDVIIANEVQWTPYSQTYIDSVWISTWHDMISLFEIVKIYMLKTVESYMPDRCPRQFGWLLYVPSDPIKATEEHMSANNKKYVVKN